MKQLMVLLALSACMASVPSEAAPVEDTALPARLDAEAPDKKTAGARNTYDMTCGPVRARFDAEPLPEALATRLALARAENERVRSTLAPGATPETIKHPVPDAALLGERRVSVACNVVFDLTPEGVPQAIAARCSDAAFEPVAAYAMTSARFKPVLLDGKAIAHKGIVYPMDFCFNE